MHAIHLLFKLNKGKGILIILYWMVSSFATILFILFLAERFGGFFLKFDPYTTQAVALFIASFWTYKTKDDYYRDSEGNKKKMDTINSFAFINMKIWSIIFLVLGLFLLFNSLFHYLPKSSFE